MLQADLRLRNSILAHKRSIKLTDSISNHLKMVL